MSFLLVAAEIISMAAETRQQRPEAVHPDQVEHDINLRWDGFEGPDQRAWSRRPRPLASNSTRWVMSVC
jgi:hypothetical protein